MRFLLCLFFFLFFSLSSTDYAATADDFAFPPPKTDALPAPDSLWATYYYVHTAVEAESGLPYRDMKGAALTRNISLRDWCLGAIEGTIQVISPEGSKTLNFAGTLSKAQVDCATVLKIDPSKRPWITSVGKSAFASAHGTYGDGVDGYQLVPWRTVAVDPTKIPVGSVVYIPAARGLPVTVAPGTTIKHDGYFFAADGGGAIKGSHIDVFCGASASNCLPAIASGSDTHPFTAYRIQDSTIANALRALHLPTHTP